MRRAMGWWRLVVQTILLAAVPPAGEPGESFHPDAFDVDAFDSDAFSGLV